MVKALFNREIIRGIFLLVLTILGTTVENTYSCQTLQFIYRNTIARQFLLICMIFFIIDFSTEKDLYPLHSLKYTIILYLLYVAISKQNIYFGSCIFLLLCTMYILNDLIDYYESLDDEKDIEHLYIALNYLFYITLSVIGMGFIVYFMKEYKEHRKTFKVVKFLFGTNKCDNKIKSSE